MFKDSECRQLFKVLDALGCVTAGRQSAPAKAHASRGAAPLIHGGLGIFTPAHPRPALAPSTDAARSHQLLAWHLDTAGLPQPCASCYGCVLTSFVLDPLCNV